MEPKIRFSFVKDGVASDWFVLPEDQAEAASRKAFHCSIPLWKKLKQSGKIFVNSQMLDPQRKAWSYLYSMRMVKA